MVLGLREGSSSLKLFKLIICRWCTVYAFRDGRYHGNHFSFIMKSIIIAAN